MAEEFTPTSFLNLENWIQNSNVSNPNGILKQNKFICLLNVPTSLSKKTLFTNNGWLEWQVLSVNVPAVAFDIGSMEVNSWQHYYLKGRTDNDLEITFLESAGLKLRHFFYQWMLHGYDPLTGQRFYTDDISAKTMKVIPLNWKGEGLTADVFRMVFPIEINSLDYDVGQSNSMLKTTVKFKYKYHTIEDANSSDFEHTATGGDGQGTYTFDKPTN